MSQEDVRAIRGLYEAFGRKDLPAMLAVLHPEVEFYQSTLLPWGGIYRGQEEAKRFFTTLVGYVDSRIDLDEIIDAGEHIVAVGHSRGRVKANDHAFEVAIAHVWTMRQGKALRFENYLDTPTMLRALYGERASTT
jgi:ketosteroid isomerase-like protein